MDPKKLKKDPSPMLRGDSYRRTHRASVIGILGDDAPAVHSRGSLFYNQDVWTARAVVSEMCKWAKENPNCTPTRKDVSGWVSEANRRQIDQREIVIANTPDKLPIRVAMALTGGAYHESFHTLYSCRRPLGTPEIANIIIPRWAKLADWSLYQEALHRWSNIIEDIRIERRGRENFDGVFVKLCDLQDFILSMEAKGKNTLKSHGGEPSTLSIIESVFRDVGLGYKTELQVDAMKQYKEDNEEAVDMVLDGPLAPLLRESIDLPEDDSLGCIRIAMDVISILGKLAGKDKEKDQQKGGNGLTECPDCGASLKDLKVRPKSDGCGNKIPGKGTITCTVCGWQQDIDIQPKSDSAKGSGNSENPAFEDFDDEGGSKDKDSSEETDGDGKNSNSEESEEDGAEDNNSGNSESSEDIDSSNNGSGGGSGEDGEHKGNDWSDVANDACEDMESGDDTGLKDSNSALEEAFNSEKEKEDKGLQDQEAPWRPYDQGLDKAEYVNPSIKGKDYDRQQADYLIKSVKAETAYLRARLRTIVRALEMSGVVHGVARGKGLSSKYLVDSRIAVQSGEQPQRAYYKAALQRDMSMWCATVLDESSSMDDQLKEASRMLIALTEPFDSINCPTLSIGFRDDSSIYDRGLKRSPKDRKSYHRTHGIRYDIFKAPHERFKNIRWRFANTRATGSTPMSDGIQFALDLAIQAPQAHRFIFVITDGHPNGNHVPIIKRQLRLAREAGIHVIGVGLGDYASYVKTLFEDHVWSSTFREIPRLLVAKLNELADIRGGRTGNRKKVR